MKSERGLAPRVVATSMQKATHALAKRGWTGRYQLLPPLSRLQLPELQGDRVSGKEPVEERLPLLLAGILIAPRGFIQCL